MALKDKLTKITFHSGILTIGGTVIEVAYKDSHIFFDFGSEYDPSNPVQPTNLQELLDAGLAPKLQNMYDRDIPITGHELQSENPFKYTAVFVSHVHLDHTKMVNYLDKDIPLYALEGTKSLLKTLNVNNDFLYPAHDAKSPNTRHIMGVEDNATIEIGDIKVKMMPMDHDAYGASGFIVTTPDLVIAYTGDLRLHGYRVDDTLRFCEESRHCDVLLIEGVTVSFQELDAPPDPERPNYSEAEVLGLINRTIEENPHRQLTFNYYIANIERILNVIKTCPREVVLEAYSAYVVKEATGIEVPYYALDDTDYGLALSQKIPFEELLQDRERFFWQLDKVALTYIGQLQAGGIYIHSNATPLGDFDPAYAPFMEAFEKAGVQVLLASSTGHAWPQDLMKIIDLIEPKLLVPIHSRRPELLTNKWGDRLLPEKNQTI